MAPGLRDKSFQMFQKLSQIGFICNANYTLLLKHMHYLLKVFSL